MRFKSIPAIIALFFMVNPSLGQGTKDPVAYMSTMDTEIKAIDTDLWTYISSVAHGKSVRKVENRRKELLTTTMAAKNKIKRLPAYEGDTEFRDSVVSFLALSYNVLNYDYAKIVDMEEIAEQSYDLMEAYLTAQEIANDKIDKAGEMVAAQQKAFALRNNVNLIEGNEDKLSSNLREAEAVNKYYNVIYLIFFKSYKQEMYFIDALNRADVNAMEQNKNAMVKYSTEGLQKLDTVKSFKGDVSLKNACKSMLDFYIMEGNKYAPNLINFYIKKDEYEKAKTAFEAKPQSKRTQTEVDQYNAVVKEFNDSVAEFNAVNDEANSKRTTFFNTWNKAVTVFFDKQIPKGK